MTWQKYNEIINNAYTSRKISDFDKALAVSRLLKTGTEIAVRTQRDGVEKLIPVEFVRHDGECIVVRDLLKTHLLRNGGIDSPRSEMDFAVDDILATNKTKFMNLIKG